MLLDKRSTTYTLVHVDEVYFTGEGKEDDIEYNFTEMIGIGSD